MARSGDQEICETGQMLNYLKITGFAVGLILNFKRAKLEFHHMVL